MKEKFYTYNTDPGKKHTKDKHKREDIDILKKKREGGGMN